MMRSVEFLRDDAEIPADAVLVVYDKITRGQIVVILQHLRVTELVGVFSEFDFHPEQFPFRINDQFFRFIDEPFRGFLDPDVDAGFLGNRIGNDPVRQIFRQKRVRQALDVGAFDFQDHRVIFCLTTDLLHR